MTERPGTIHARKLFSSASPSKWLSALSTYEQAIALLSRSKKKPLLLDLDQKWQRELRVAVSQRSPPHLLFQELSYIMQWKLLRGKFRPLQKLVDSNTETSVHNISIVALRHAENSDWEAAITEFTKLKGVGVATASAILAPLYPAICPFMADEVIEVTTTGKRDYNMKVYKQMREVLVDKAIVLEGTWNAEMVGRAIWASATLYALGAEEKGIELSDMSLPQIPSGSGDTGLNLVGAGSKKRKLTTDSTDDDKNPSKIVSKV